MPRISDLPQDVAITTAGFLVVVEGGVTYKFPLAGSSIAFTDLTVAGNLSLSNPSTARTALELTYSAKGSEILGTGNGAIAERTVGANGTVKVADSSQATGHNWASLGAGLGIAGNVISVSEFLSISRIDESVGVLSAATGNINLDALTRSVTYHSTDASGNFNINIRGNASTSLNDTISENRSVTMVMLVKNGATPYHALNITVDGSAPDVIAWLGGSPPSVGNANSIDSYTLTAIKTSSGNFTVLADMAQYA